MKASSKMEMGLQQLFERIGSLECQIRALAEQKKEVCKPNLGCATTRELLEEIKVRIEIDGNLDYKTTDNN